MRRLFQQILAAAALADALSPPKATAEKLGARDIEETATPPTRAASISAVLTCTQPLINFIGAAAPAGMVLRCRNQQLVPYVGGFQALSTISALFTAQTQHLVIWRTNQRSISANRQQVDNAFIAAIMFSTTPAGRLIEKLTGAEQLVAWMSSSSSTPGTVFGPHNVDRVTERISKSAVVAWSRCQ